MRLAVAGKLDSAVAEKLQAHDVAQSVILFLDVDHRKVDLLFVDSHLLRLCLVLKHGSPFPLF